jgi:hypothetical protein
MGRRASAAPSAPTRPRRTLTQLWRSPSPSSGEGEWVSPERGRITLRRWVEDHWWPTKQHLKPKTLEGYRYELDHFILPGLGDRVLDRLTTQVIAEWRSRLLQRPKLHPNTVAKAYRLLSQVLSAAVEDRYIGVNPAKIKGAAKETPKEIDPPTVPQALALADAMPDRFRLVVVLYAFTGLRLGEIQAQDLRLPWERPRNPHTLTPARVRRGFRRLRPLIGTPASPPKPAEDVPSSVGLR